MTPRASVAAVLVVGARTRRGERQTTSPAPGAHRPGLDGLRTLAVAAVVLFHLGRLPGGNLGVDIFFVLSGWLITWKLLQEAERHERPRIALRTFWAGRIRRLMPASLAVLATVAVVWPLAGIDVPTLRHDIWWAAAWMSNWGTIQAGGNYWARFGEPSPITHFWSLAVEEQYYIVWPLLLAGVLRIGRRHRALVGGVAALAAIGSIAYMNVRFDPANASATYLDTFARAHSLLIGAAAAAFTASRADGSLRGGRTAHRLAPLAALAGIAVIAISGEGSSWLFRWGFPVFALLTAVVVVAAADGWAAPVLATRPMRFVADRSYAIYLWHWPVILLLAPERMGIGGVPLDVVRIALTVALADLSLRILEGPVRQRRVLRSWRAPLAGAVALATVAGLAVMTAPSGGDEPAATVVTLPAVSAPVAAPPSTPAPTTTVAPLTASAGPVPDGDAIAGTVPDQKHSVQGAGAVAPARPVRALVAGDSTAVHLSTALLDYAAGHPTEMVAGSAAFPGCGLTAATDGRMHQFTDARGRRQLIDLSGCTTEWTAVPQRVRDEQIDVVVVSIGPWDAVDIHLPDGSVVSVADPVGHGLVLEAYRTFIDSVRAAGATIVWIRPADAHVGWGKFDDPLDDPARWTALRGILDELDVRQIDLPAWLASHQLEGKEGRPDGVHLTDAANAALVAEEVAPTVERLAVLRSSS